MIHCLMLNGVTGCFHNHTRHDVTNDPKRSIPMGDKKSKKDKAKQNRQSDVKNAQAAKKKQANQKTKMP